MTQTLVFLLGADCESPILWGHVSEVAPPRTGRVVDAKALATLKAEAESAARVVAVLRGEDAAVRLLTSPPKGATRALAAARLLLEDELAEPIETVHVATSAYGTSVRAVAVAREVIDPWIAAFAEAGLPLDGLYVDFLLLPTSEEGGAVIVRDGRIIASAGGLGFAGETGFLAGAPLAAALGKDRRIALVARPADRLSVASLSNVEVAGEADDDSFLALLVKGLESASALNLLQGALRPRTPWKARAAPWRRAAVLAGAAAALSLIAVAADAARHLREAARWKEAAAVLHTRAFPDVPVSDAVANARASLAKNGGPSLAALTRSVAEASRADSAVEVSRVRFEAGKGEFHVSVKSLADADIEKFKARLAGAGLAVADSGGYRRNGAVWTGELTVRMR